MESPLALRLEWVPERRNGSGWDLRLLDRELERHEFGLEWR